MAKGKSTGKIVVELTEPKTKKHVTRFDSEDPKAAMLSAYINREALAKELGTDAPDKIKVTIERA